MSVLEPSFTQRPDIGALDLLTRRHHDPVLQRAVGEFDLINVGARGTDTVERYRLNRAKLDDRSLHLGQLLARATSTVPMNCLLAT